MGDSAILEENLRGLTLPRGFKVPEEEEYDTPDELPVWQRPIIRRRNSTPWNRVRKEGLGGRYRTYSPSFSEDLSEENNTSQQANGITPDKLSREASQSLGNIGRKSSNTSLNSVSSSSGLNSPLDPSRTLYWSASLLYYTGTPSPTIKNKHLMCQVPGSAEDKSSTMDRRRVTKQPSIDSGSGSATGSMRRRHSANQSPAPPAGRKRQNSIGSSSTNSSSSVGSLNKDKNGETKASDPNNPQTPVSSKKRNSLTSLITNRKGSLRKRPESSTREKTSPVTSDVGDDGDEARQNSRCFPSTNDSSAKGLRESIKAAKHFLSQGQKAGEDEVCERLSRTMSRELDTAAGRSTSPVKNGVQKKSLTLPMSNGKHDDRDIPASNGKASTLGSKEKSPGLEKSSTKSPARKALGKLFSKKTRMNFGESGHPDMAEDTIVVRKIVTGKGEDNCAPNIVTFESEPRVLVPKTKATKAKTQLAEEEKKPIVTLGKNNRHFKEMEVSEEAVALAKQIKEQQRKEDEEKIQKRQRRHGSEATPPADVNGLPVDVAEKKEVVLNGRPKHEHLFDGLQETAIDDTVQSGYEHGLVEAEVQNQAFEHPLRANADSGNHRNEENSELESGIGSETPPSSLEEQLGNHTASSTKGRGFQHMNGNRIVVEEGYDEDEDVRNLTKSGDSKAPTEIDDDEASEATTVTTESDYDTSLNLSKSLALTDNSSSYSYTESFKQLKPFQFENHLPVHEGKRERLYKVLVVGELGTGKTSIIKRYVHQFFSQHYRATIGVDFALKVLRWDPETVVRLQLWDIAGQERFGSMTRVYYKEAVGAFVVFDVTRGATLEAVPKWKADLDAKVVLPDGRPIPTILLANKSDQPKEGIAANREKMNEFCQQQGFSGWFETSAKDNINIEESANFLVSQILEMDKWSQEPMASDPDKLDLGANGKHRGGGSSSCSC